MLSVTPRPHETGPPGSRTPDLFFSREVTLNQRTGRCRPCRLASGAGVEPLDKRDIAVRPLVEGCCSGRSRTSISRSKAEGPAVERRSTGRGLTLAGYGLANRTPSLLHAQDSNLELLDPESSVLPIELTCTALALPTLPACADRNSDPYPRSLSPG